MLLYFQASNALMLWNECGFLHIRWKIVLLLMLIGFWSSLIVVMLEFSAFFFFFSTMQILYIHTLKPPFTTNLDKSKGNNMSQKLKSHCTWGIKLKRIMKKRRNLPPRICNWKGTQGIPVICESTPEGNQILSIPENKI